VWWYTSGTTTKEGLHELHDWLGFWHFHYRQWGESMKKVQVVATLTLSL
jgi:hypothetical protein